MRAGLADLPPYLKTGDLARYDCKGNLYFISRKDTWIKINGQRVELDKVQHHVRKLMGDIIGAVVCCTLGEPKHGKEQMLAAFMSCQNAGAAELCALTVPTTTLLATLETLDKNLRALISSYIIPAIYYFITTVPRTVSGKVNRKRLVELATQAPLNQVYRGRPNRQVICRNPSTPVEGEIQRLWSVALGLPIDTIGADDNFFDLNGDSISTIRLVATARGEGYNLRVSDIFANPTLLELALRI